MPILLALPLTIFSAWMTVRAFRASRDASRAGQFRYLMRWHQRDRSPLFFKIALAQTRFDILFFGCLTIVASAFLLEALGFIR
jgi:hypothetical protein